MLFRSSKEVLPCVAGLTRYTRPMFKWILCIAFVLSLLFCGWREYDAQRRLEVLRADITHRRAELQSLHDIDQELRVYMMQRDALQKRIDLINQLKQSQRTPASAIAKLSGVGPTTIESAAVVNNTDLVINRR